MRNIFIRIDFVSWHDFGKKVTQPLFAMILACHVFISKCSKSIRVFGIFLLKYQN